MPSTFIGDQNSPCRCLCPCHFDKLRHGTNNEECPQIVRDYRMEGCCNSDPGLTYRTSLQCKGTTPVAAPCLSKSFLHVKHLVKTMKSRWESFSEDRVDISRLPACKEDKDVHCRQCASNIEFSGGDSVDNPGESTIEESAPCLPCISNIKWDAEPIDQTTHPKHGKDVMKSTDQYTLEPLQRSRSREFMPPRSVPDEYKQVPNHIGIVSTARRSFEKDLDTSFFMETVHKQSSDMELQSIGDVKQVKDSDLPPRPNNTRAPRSAIADVPQITITSFEEDLDNSYFTETVHRQSSDINMLPTGNTKQTDVHQINYTHKQGANNTFQNQDKPSVPHSSHSAGLQIARRSFETDLDNSYFAETVHKQSSDIDLKPIGNAKKVNNPSDLYQTSNTSKPATNKIGCSRKNAPRSTPPDAPQIARRSFEEDLDNSYFAETVHKQSSDIELQSIGDMKPVDDTALSTRPNNMNAPRSTISHVPQVTISSLEEDLDNSYFAETVHRQSSDIAVLPIGNGKHVQDTDLHETNKRVLHPTNPFKMDIQIQGAETDDSTIRKSNNKKKACEKPHTVRSEVSSIRRSFEAAAAEVVANVNRKSLDLNNRHPREPLAVKPIAKTTETIGYKSKTERPNPEIEWKVNNGRQTASNAADNDMNPKPMQNRMRIIAESTENNEPCRRHFESKQENPGGEASYEHRKSLDEKLLFKDKLGCGGGRNRRAQCVACEERSSNFSPDKQVDNKPTQTVTDVAIQTETFRTEVYLTLQNDMGRDQNGESDQSNQDSGRRRSSGQGKSRRDSYTHESMEGLLAVAAHNRSQAFLVNNGVEHINKKDDSKEKVNKRVPQTVPQQPGQPKSTKQRKDMKENEGGAGERSEFGHMNWIQNPNSKCIIDENVCRTMCSSDHPSKPESAHTEQPSNRIGTRNMSPELLKNVSTTGVYAVNTQSSVALQMEGHELRRATLTDEEGILTRMSEDYDNVLVSPPTLQVEVIGRSVSVTNTTTHQQPGTNQRHSSGDAGRINLAGFNMYRKKQFHICHKCHKIVEAGEVAFYLVGGFETAWHRSCFKCHVCQKELTESDHSFFEGEPYCIDHYIKIAKIPKCFQCHELIFESTFTSAAGHSWHQDHFSCHSCKRALVDTKYVFSQGKFPYCFPCHEKVFPKYCRTCEGRISPQEPYVQSGDTFWHSNDACLQCLSCKRSLVGRSLFFRKDGHLYCNRYCAVREI